MIPDTPRRTFAAVVCVCCEKDSAVWAISSPQIVKSIVSGSYGVIVPDQEVEHFERVSAPQFKVMAESKYLYWVQFRGFAILVSGFQGQPGRMVHTEVGQDFSRRQPR